TMRSHGLAARTTAAARGSSIFAFEVAEHLVDDLARTDSPPKADGRANRVCGGCPQCLGERDQCLPERPATAARPRLVVYRKPVAEGIAAVTVEQRPRDREVAGGIADGRATEVEHPGQPTADYEQIRCRHI